jgi:hypothetical protein
MIINRGILKIYFNIKVTVNQYFVTGDFEPTNVDKEALLRRVV